MVDGAREEIEFSCPASVPPHRHAWVHNPSLSCNIPQEVMSKDDTEDGFAVFQAYIHDHRPWREPLAMPRLQWCDCCFFCMGRPIHSSHVGSRSRDQRLFMWRRSCKNSSFCKQCSATFGSPERGFLHSEAVRIGLIRNSASCRM